MNALPTPGVQRQVSCEKALLSDDLLDDSSSESSDDQQGRGLEFRPREILFYENKASIFRARRGAIRRTRASRSILYE
ncbi:hypothetical protein N7468_010603 [Penicillium chermesinum]|uniref:Uncharacterized protein n=1 Tax=Penicillium chermesinum TaxID=63820 RepID=A0A9W9TA66_9EURO|nr:uncharacterized protein N7468_010603 [Penicillium chermesinum]KAJ5214924.1 hypothetical protein N7468_010603 [Penicillium chermesinum]KAJ6141572.1 hypothetical protein N7470_009962 [Penicillium chermesinum]